MTGAQAFRHFDSAQCDIRVWLALFLFIELTINYLQCHPERSRRTKRHI